MKTWSNAKSLTSFNINMIMLLDKTTSSWMNLNHLIVTFISYIIIMLISGVCVEVFQSTHYKIHQSAVVAWRLMDAQKQWKVRWYCKIFLPGLRSNASPSILGSTQFVYKSGVWGKRHGSTRRKARRDIQTAQNRGKVCERHCCVWPPFMVVLPMLLCPD